MLLIRKARGAWDPFATVFRGRIVSAGGGSALKGCFTKRLFDYFLLLLLFAADGYFYLRLREMGNTGVSGAVGCLVFAVLLMLLTIPLPAARRRYRTFLKDIACDHTDEE